MQISPEVLKNIKRIVFLEYEPNDRTVMWAKPSDSGEFVFLVYNNGAWQQLSSADGVTINISDISVNLSAFNNDAGFVTSTELSTAVANKQDKITNLDTIVSGASAGATAYQKPQAGIPKSDLSTDVQSSY